MMAQDLKQTLSITAGDTKQKLFVAFYSPLFKLSIYMSNVAFNFCGKDLKLKHSLYGYIQ
jgi:hypothetical protein